ncbi:MAG: ATP-binding cassette domain-containing protein, partial [Oscillospiraceae bacterium]
EGFELSVEFSVKNSETLCILGKSGSGKSTLLNLISGVLLPDSGIIKTDTTEYFNSENKANVPIHKRRIGYIEQKANLFPHLSVKQNIFYGIKDKANDKEQYEKFEFLLKTFSLKGQENKMPIELSGGQQQRVSIIRAIMSNPEILLLDEPFSALDTNLRNCLRKEILKLRDRYNIPMIFVTHDLEEAYFLCDKTIIIEDGKVIAKGKKKDVFLSPTNMKQARFVGFSNIVPSKVIEKNTENFDIELYGTTVNIKKTPPKNSDVFVGIRSSNFVLEQKENLYWLEIEIEEITEYFDKTEVKGKVSGYNQKIDVILPTWETKNKNFKVGSIANIYFNSKDICVFEA